MTSYLILPNHVVLAGCGGAPVGVRAGVSGAASGCISDGVLLPCPGPASIERRHLTGVGGSVLEKRRPVGRLSFGMGLPIPVRKYETASLCCGGALRSAGVPA